ncbi:hypothetical protein [Variovorax sp. Root318D1]|uniref:hypothetical protein n=1 Tax=Variovorax sp. Root318D1 TaxID=1736513 RepID=UPI0012FAB37E|nr:hypothetical protein [Variovorax sp. Root318D1]
MNFSRHHSMRPRGLLTAAFLGVAALVQQHAFALDVNDGSVYFCPTTTTSAGSKMNGIMCDAEHCYNSRSPKLDTAQRLFLESAKEKCRYLSDQEVAAYWPEYAPTTAAAPAPTTK